MPEPTESKNLACLSRHGHRSGKNTSVWTSGTTGFTGTGSDSGFGTYCHVHDKWAASDTQRNATIKAEMPSTFCSGCYGEELAVANSGKKPAGPVTSMIGPPKPVVGAAREYQKPGPRPDSPEYLKAQEEYKTWQASRMTGQ
jgi:hypothetical protein